MSDPRDLTKDMPEDLEEALEDVIEEVAEELDDIEDEAAAVDNMGDRERAERARKKLREARAILRGTA